MATKQDGKAGREQDGAGVTHVRVDGRARIRTDRDAQEVKRNAANAN